MIAAILSVCMAASPAQCSHHAIHADPRACHIAPLAIEAPVNGAWTALTVRIACAAPSTIR